jgi:hypothetical protein
MIAVIYEHLTDRLAHPAAASDSLGMGIARSGVLVGALILLTVIASGCATTSGAVRPSPFPGSATRDGARPSVVVPPGLVHQALALRGTPYRLGGEEPRTGLDCSGLVRYVFRAEGIVVPRTVVEQFAIGMPVKGPDLQPGDLIFFDTTEPGPSHVGIAVDAETFVHAPGSGGVVRVERLASRYWKDRLRGIKRVGLSSRTSSSSSD